MEWQGLDFIGVGLLVFLRQYKVRRRAPINAAALLAASVAAMIGLKGRSGEFIFGAEVAS